MTIVDYSHNHLLNPYGEGFNVQLDVGGSQPVPPVPPNTHKVEGRVYNYQGNPVSRKVCVFSKTTDQFLGSTTSDATTGFYSISFASPDPVFVVCFPNVDEDINAKIYDRVVPVSV